MKEALPQESVAPFTITEQRDATPIVLTKFQWLLSVGQSKGGNLVLTLPSDRF